jgi:Putative heavy-metal-binding
MKYKFHGVATDGSEKNGTVSADSEDDALRKIKAAGIFVSRIDAVVETVPFVAAPSPPIPAESALSQRRSPHGEVVVSSGPICAEYNVLGLVVGFASKTEGCSGTIAVEGVYQMALQRLIEGARGRGANGLIHVNFQNRVASQAGCGSAKQVFEVFAWGTAIQF